MKILVIPAFICTMLALPVQAQIHTTNINASCKKGVKVTYAVKTSGAVRSVIYGSPYNQKKETTCKNSAGCAYTHIINTPGEYSESTILTLVTSNPITFHQARCL